MKSLAIFILLSFALPVLGQKEISMNDASVNRGTIKVRKLSFDTITTIKTEMDSTSPGWEIVDDDKDRHKPRYKGYVNEYILVRGGNMYVFNSPISEKDQSRTFDKDHSSKFWRKIRRQKKRGKIHYFRVKCTREWVDSTFHQFFNDYEVDELYFSESDIVVKTFETKIENSTVIDSTTDYYARYIFLKDSFYFPIPTGWNFNRNNNNYNFVEYINSVLKDSTNTEILKIKLSCPKTIAKNKYVFEFDLKTSASNTVKITRNGNETFVCNYRIKGRDILIENPPIPEFAKGRVNSRINRIRFKIHTATHEYTIK